MNSNFVRSCVAVFFSVGGYRLILICIARPLSFAVCSKYSVRISLLLQFLLDSIIAYILFKLPLLISVRIGNGKEDCTLLKFKQNYFFLVNEVDKFFASKRSTTRYDEANN